MVSKAISFLFKPIERLFLWSSGADLDVLELVPTEKTKYYGIGGTIIFTALMASFAGGYAFFTAFDDVLLSVFFGLFWGALIFNLDRYIVASFGVGDGKRTISRQELFEAAPRLLMATLLGFVIATPLELKLFEGEIEAWIGEQIALAGKRIEGQYDLTSDPDIVAWRGELNTIEGELKDMSDDEARKRTERNLADAAQEQEWVYGCDQHPPGKGPHHSQLMDRYVAKRSEYDSLLSRNSGRRSELYQQRTETNQKIQNREAYLNQMRQRDLAEADKSRGLMMRLEGLGALTTRSAAIWWSKWLITLLFIFVEIAPVLFKMMTERGPYDDIVDQKKYEVLLAEQMKRSKMNEDANATLKANRSNHEEFLNAEMMKNREMLQLIVDAQKEIAAEAIAAWKEEQKERMRNNVGAFVKTTSSAGSAR